MKAVYVKEFGGGENLEWRDVADLPNPSGAQVFVNVKASALNRADILQRKGFYPAPAGFPERILGLEFAGVVAEIGENVKDFKTGDRVFGITAGGANAESLLSDASLLVKIPENLSFIEAAAIPEAFLTAHDALFTQASLKENETLLIHAVASGVGLAALQLAKARNIKVFGTSRTNDKLDRCKQFGLDEPILAAGEADFDETIREKTDGKGVDVILDLVGAKYFAANLKSLALEGRLMLVGTPGGARGELDFGLLMSKRAQITGTLLRSRPTEEKAEATRRFAAEVAPLIEKGLIKPNIDRVFNIEDIKAAHEYLESNESFGKVVLLVNGKW